MQSAIAPRQEGPVVGNRGKATDLVIDGMFPGKFACDGIQTIERRILGPKQHMGAMEVWPSVNLRIGLKVPNRFARGSVNAIKLPVHVADVDATVADPSGGRKPDFAILTLTLRIITLTLRILTLALG